MPDRKFGFDTLCLHAGQIPDAATGARALPIYQTTSFVFDSADHAASLFNLQTFGNVYSRISNPTVAALEERVAALEGGRAALATATGMAAQMVALLTLCRAGDHIVAVAHALRRHLFAARGDVRAVRHRDHVRRQPTTPRASGARCKPEHQGGLRRDDRQSAAQRLPTSRRIAEVAHDAGVPLVVDNTLASPYLCRPFEHGADIVIHSVTKYLGGHGTTMGGILVESGKFPWDNGNFPQMTEPSRGYHGVRFYETFGDFGFTMKARMETMRTLGPDALAALGVPAAAGHRDAAPAHAAALRVGARGRAASRRASGGRVGRTIPLLARQPLSTRSRERYLPRGAGGILTFGVQAAAPRPASEFIEARAVPLASRQRRRREDAGHPSGVDDAPPAVARTSSARPASRRR